MASIRDVAKKAGVGVGTVSRALNGTGYVSEEAKKKIETAMKELEYTPNELARNLFRNRTGIIGIIVPNMEHPFFAGLCRVMETALYERGYKTMICNTIGISNREKDYLDMLDRSMVDGIITAAHSLDGDEYLKRKKPIISIDRNFGPEIPLIGSDHAMGGRMAAEVLIKNGCRKVLQLSNLSPFVLANERHTAFHSIMAKNDIEVVEAVMDWNNLTYEEHYKVVKEYLRLYPDVDGAFGSDYTAIACLNVITAMGKKVPEEFKIVGFDAMNITRMVRPAVTAVRQNIQLLGECCAESIIKRIEGVETVPYRQILKVEMQYGGTTIQ
ncbi:MAG: LacI family DNA-binding transcriptional regulator [Lachnospiraceae bacterium]|nr:LacI family DNA-binding transcriptional regulator [Lachnospiraceae bacterium]